MKTFEQYRMLSKEAKRRIVQRYALYQIPDMAILVLILFVLHQWVGLSLGLFIGLVSPWMVKYVLVFSFVWRAYDKPRIGDVTSLIGIQGIAEELLDPSGYNRGHSELWQAELIGKTMAIRKRQVVLIERAYGLTLLVKPFQKR
jgi:membrane-bound ClpP family serine protease